MLHCATRMRAFGFYVLSFLMSCIFTVNAFSQEAPTERGSEKEYVTIDNDVKYGLFAKAKKELELLIQKKQKALPVDEVGILHAKLRLAHVLTRHFDINGAAKILQDVRQVADSQMSARSSIFEQLDYEQALLFMAQEDFAKAQKILNPLYDAQSKIWGDTHKTTLDTRIAWLKASQNSTEDEAWRKAFAQCVADVKKHYPEPAFALTALYGFEASFLLKRNQVQEAQQRLQDNYENLMKTYGRYSPEAHSASVELVEFYLSSESLADAERMLREGVTLIQKSYGPDSELLVRAYNVLGGLRIQQGDGVAAVEFWTKAYEMSKKYYGLQDHATIVAMNNLAMVLGSLGDIAVAENMYLEALQVAEQSLAPHDETYFFLYSGLAEIYKRQKRFSEAAEIMAKLENVKMHSGQEKVLMLWQRALNTNNLIYTGKSKKAYEDLKVIYAELSTLVEKNDSRLLDVLYVLRRAALAQNDIMKAQELSIELMGRQMLSGGLSSHDMAISFMNAAQFIKDHNKGLAIFYSKVAINSLRMLRNTNIGLQQDLIKTYQKSIEQVYHMTLDLLVATGRYEDALNVISIMKETELDDFLLNKQANIEVVKDLFDEEEQKNFKKLMKISNELHAIGQELLPLERKADVLTLQERKRKDALSAKVDSAIKNELTQYFYQVVSAYENVNGASLAISATESKNITSLKNVLKTVRGEGLLIYPVATKEMVYFFVVSKEQVVAYDVKASLPVVAHLVNAFSAAVKDPQSDVRPMATELYNLLMDPIENELLRVKPSTLLFSLDGFLRYIPMSALYDGKKWLVEEYDVVHFVDSTRGNLAQSPPQDGTIAAMGITHGLSGFSALPSVSVELDAIVKKATNQGVVQGEIFLNESFTYDAFTRVLQQKTPLLHIASHFVFDPVKQENSFLLLGDGSKLTMGQLFAQHTSLFEHVDLLTLSACNTGSGVEKGDGREVESFGAMAQRQGAKTVMATLWPVADASTAALMKEFYSERTLRKKLKSTSLADAQRSFISKNITYENTGTGLMERGKVLSAPQSQALPSSNKVDWSHPFFWSAFILMGNWQ